MATDVILTDWTIHYDTAAGPTTGFKQLKWTGTTGSTDINILYSEVIHFFNDPATQTFVDDFQNTTPMNSVTPTEYEIGKFDAGDPDPWFIDEESIKHITGGSLKSVGWTRTTGTDTGIVRIAYTLGTEFVKSDVGRAVTTTGDSATGRLLHFDDVAGIAWIRPTDNTATHDWATAGTVSATGGTGSVTQVGAATTGEYIWANLFTLGTVKAGTQLYMSQSDALILNALNPIHSTTAAWWGTDQIDVLILVSYQAVLIDSGLLTVYGRDYGDLYDHFQIDASAGGRNPVPLSITADSNNNVTQATANGYGVTFAYSANNVQDISDGGGNQPYDVTVNCNARTVQEVYEAFKEHTRLGETGDIDTAGSEVAIAGEQYKGQEIQLEYTLGTTFTLPASGTLVTGGTSGATGELIGQDNVGTLFINLSNVKGVFQASETVTQSPGAGSGTVVSVTSSTLQKSSPLGVFAGGKLLCARGVFLTNLGASQGQLYEVIDNNGVTRTEPVTRTFQVIGVKAGSEIRMYTDDGLRTEITSTESPTPGIENSTEFLNAAGDATLVSGGTGYFVGDILTMTLGTGTAIQLTVATVSGSTILTVTLTNGGLYTVTPTKSTHTNGGQGGGTGTNASFTFSFTSTPFIFTYTYAADVAAYVQIMHTAHPYIKLSNVTLADADQTIPVSQATDRTYI